MVGSGVYLLPATLGAIGSISILGWLAAGLAAVAIAAVFIQLAPAAPEARGVPAYVQAGLGPLFGVQSAVLYWCSIWIGLVPLSLAAAGALGFIFPVLAPPEVRLALNHRHRLAGRRRRLGGPAARRPDRGPDAAGGPRPGVAGRHSRLVRLPAAGVRRVLEPAGSVLVAAVKSSGLSCFWPSWGWRRRPPRPPWSAIRSATCRVRPCWASPG
jgi:arginine:agmatine antiporter